MGATYPTVEGVEIDHDQRTSDAPTTTNTGGIDVPGVPTIDVPAGDRPVVIQFGCPWGANGVTATEIAVLLLTDSSNAEIGRAQTVIQANNGFGPGFHGRIRLAAPATPKTYKLRYLSTFGTAVGLKATVSAPIYIEALER